LKKLETTIKDVKKIQEDIGQIKMKLRTIEKVLENTDNFELQVRFINIKVEQKVRVVFFSAIFYGDF